MSGQAAVLRAPGSPRRLLALAGLALLWGFALVYLVDTLQHVLPSFGFDSHAYWIAARGPLEYSRAPKHADAYLYSPAFAQLLRPVALLPWPAFALLWSGFLSVVLCWLLLPLAPRWSIPVALLCLPELILGNVFLLLAAATVLGMTRPAAWSFGMLTKVTPGVGLLWFAGGGEWGRLGRALAWTAGGAALSAAIEPAAWQRWIAFLLEQGSGASGPLSPVVRVAIAAVLVVAAAGDRRAIWVIAVALVIANPVWGGATTPFTMLAAIPRLTQQGGAVIGDPPLPRSSFTRLPGLRG